MRYTKNKNRKRKGYLKIHIAVYVKSKEILSKITDERVNESKVLPELVDNIVKSNKTIGKLFGDGAYEGNDIFRSLADNDIHPFIKVRKNARVGLDVGHFHRNLLVLAQRNNFKNGKTAEAMEIDGWLKLYFLPSRNSLGIYICIQISKYRKRDGYESIIV